MKAMMGESSSNVKSKGDPPSCDGHILYTCEEYNIHTGNPIPLSGRYHIVIFATFIHFGDLCRLIFLLALNLTGSSMLRFMTMHK